jgi:hypothetical protein
MAEEYVDFVLNQALFHTTTERHLGVVEGMTIVSSTHQGLDRQLFLTTAEVCFFDNSQLNPSSTRSSTIPLPTVEVFFFDNSQLDSSSSQSPTIPSRTFNHKRCRPG